MTSKRQRGVKASRIKLEHFMSEAGIKSQAELARKIADIEGLESEPKDLVNRIFRQNKVEHYSLERVANALNIDAYKLYLTQDDQALISDNQKASEDDNSVTPANSTQLVNSKLLILIVGGIIIALVGLLSLQLAPKLASPRGVESSLLYPADEALYPLALDIIAYQKNQRVGLVPQVLFNDFELTNEAFKKYEVDHLWVLEVEAFDRYRSIFLNYYADNKKVTVAAVNLTENELSQSHQYISQVFKHFLDHGKVQHDNDHDLKKEASVIVQARHLAEQYFSETNIDQASELLDTLTTPSAESLAIQCLINAQVGWQSNEKESFKQAEHLCEKAIMLDSKHPFVLSTNAFRLFRNGQYEEATRAYELVLEQYPNNIEGLLGQAELSLRYYLQAPTEREGSLHHAIMQTQKAIVQNPLYWKSFNLLSNAFYLSKQPDKALDVLNKLAELAPNQLVLANGALLSLCLNRLDESVSYSQRMIDINPSSYIAYETMYFIHTYRGELNEALSAMNKVVSIFDKEQGGLHLQWGQLADAHRWLGQKALATTYYKKALVEYEQDNIKKQTITHDQIYALYYQSAIERMQNVALSTSIKAQLEQLDISVMPTSHQVKAAIIFHWLDQQQSMLAIKQNILNICPIYQHAIDLAQ